MARYIDANKIRYSWTYDEDGTEHDGITLESIVDKVPTADVVEMKHAEWIYNPETVYLKSGYTCSACKHPMWHSHDVPQAFKYCPNCGAKMDGETK